MKCRLKEPVCPADDRKTRSWKRRATHCAHWTVRGLIGLILAMVSTVSLHASTINAPSCSQLDVQSAVNAAITGDTVMIPAGICVWTTQVLISTGITLQGQGIGATIIKDALPTNNSNNALSPLISWTCVTNGAHRLTGIEFQNGGRTPGETNGIIRFRCVNLGSTTVRVDHNKFDHLNGDMLTLNTAVGVTDHNIFLSKGNNIPIVIRDSNWNASMGQDGSGDFSWATVNPVTWGSSQFMYIEDNTISYDPGTKYICNDGFSGARAVYRFNATSGCNFEVHGTESSNRQRGTRAVEIYKNTVNGVNQTNILADIRSGAALIWGNTGINLQKPARTAKLDNFRSINNFTPFGGADGQNPWDVNDSANPYGQYTVDSLPANVQVGVSTATWTPGQWVGYTIKKTSPCPATNCFALITANTATTITYVSSSAQGFGASLAFNIGDGFMINRVVTALDQPGRGGGSLVSGGSPARPASWNDQYNDPLYQWLNTGNGINVPFGFDSSCSTCRPNEHLYDYTPTFDGSAGVGAGPAGTRPTSCTAGVAFWATDEGAWNTTGIGGQGDLYKCTAPNVWTLAYTPYTYPHPLIAGSGSGTTVATFTVADRGGVSLTSAGIGLLSVGYARIQATAGTTPSGLAMVSYRQNGILVSEAGIPASPLVQSGRIFAEVNGPINTGIAIANPNNQSATISFFFTDQNGNDFGAGTTVIPANGQIANFLTEKPFCPTGPMGVCASLSVVGSFTFNSSVPVSTIALRGLTNERADFLISTLPVGSLTPPSGQTAVFPHFADGAGWITQAVLVNPTDGVISGSVQFVDQGSSTTSGQPTNVSVAGQTASSFTYSIPPRTSWTIQTSGSAQNVQEGSVRLLADPNTVVPSGLVIFSYKNTRATVAEGSVQASNPGTAFRMYAETSGTFGQIGSIATGIAITNTSANPANVTFELTNLAGSPSGLPTPAATTIPANGQIAVFLNQIAGFESLPATFRGVLRVSSSSSAISLIGLRGLYNERGDFLITTLPAVDESIPPVTTELVFPHLVDGGGYTTQFILFSGAAGQTSAGNLLIMSQSGQPLSLLLLP